MPVTVFPSIFMKLTNFWLSSYTNRHRTRLEIKVGAKMMGSSAVWFSVVDFLFFFHGYGFGGTGSHAGHAKNAIICSDRNRSLSVWIVSKILKFEDIDRTNIHADAVAVALVPVNRNLWHLFNLDLVLIQRIRDFKTLRCVSVLAFFLFGPQKDL